MSPRLRLLTFLFFPRVLHIYSPNLARRMSTLPAPAWNLQYPPARRSNHVDIYESAANGQVRVHDPYEWLEHNTPETEAWTTNQEKFTREFLERNTQRKGLENEFRKNMDYAKFSAPSFYNDSRYYWFYNTGLQAQSVMYRSADSTLPNVTDLLGGEVFFDSNLLSTDGTVALADFAMSHDGKLFAYSLSTSGSDSTIIYIRPTDAPLAEKDGKCPEKDDKRLADELHFVKFSSIEWTHDSRGFFYQRYPEGKDSTGRGTAMDTNAMIYYHRVRTSQSEDILVHKDDSNPTWLWSTGVSEQDGKYIVLYAAKDTSRTNKLWISNLDENEIGSEMKWDKVVDDYSSENTIICNHGTKFFIHTNENAPQYKVITIDLADPTRERKDFIPEDKNAHLTSIKAVNNDKFVVVYKRNVKDEIYVYSTAGEQLTRLAEDFVGAVHITATPNRPEFFASMTGFTTPNTVGHYDFKEPNQEARWSIYRTTKIEGLNPDDFNARQVWYESKDGTKVPMFIVRHNSTEFDGTAPAIQYGYGGFSISIDPFFSPTILTFLKMYNAILAVPSIRGGSEFGEEWHLAGTRERKHNTFDDFIAATEHLVKNKYAGAGKVAINGGSNGGYLVAACVNRAPEGTFGAAVAEVGVLDLLKFADFTIGKMWTSDYGDPHDPKDFDFIYPLSPLHNIPTDKILPPTILLTADHDDRVVPLHSFKHAATLQHTLPHNPNPLLIRIDKKAGHGAGKSTEKRIQEAADKWGFVVQTLGLEPTQISETSPLTNGTNGFVDSKL